jgi:hypothetical protein
MIPAAATAAGYPSLAHDAGSSTLDLRLPQSHTCAASV